MLLHDELLEQARALVQFDARRPRQASLRRAISTAYYAVFHLLVHDASTHLVGAAQAGIASEINYGVRRWFLHGTMKDCAKWFLGKETPSKLNALFQPAAPVAGGPIPAARVLATLVSPALRNVADAFVDLQNQRHRADYDLGAPRFTRQGTRIVVQRAEQAFADWRTAQADPLLPLFTLLLLTGEGVIPRK